MLEQRHEVQDAGAVARFDQAVLQEGQARGAVDGLGARRLRNENPEQGRPAQRGEREREARDHGGREPQARLQGKGQQDGGKGESGSHHGMIASFRHGLFGVAVARQP